MDPNQLGSDVTKAATQAQAAVTADVTKAESFFVKYKTQILCVAAFLLGFILAKVL